MAPTSIRNYLNHVRSEGDSRWWTWIMVFWFTLIGMALMQSIILSPAGEIMNGIDPELAQAFNTASLAIAENITPLVGVGFLVLLITVPVGAILFLANRTTTGKKQTVFGWITAICVALSVIFAIIAVPAVNAPEANAIFSQFMAQSPLIYMLMLLTFPAILVGLFLGQKFIHQRSLLALHTGFSRIRWGRMLAAAGLTFAVWAAVSGVLALLGVAPLSLTFDPSRFWIYALISVLFIPFQAATEEIVIRGYLNQWAAKYVPVWMAFVITSLLFAALHLANPEIGEASGQGLFWITISSYFIFGLAMCAVVWFDNGLEAAIGIHAANNIFAAVFVNAEVSVLPTPSVWTTVIVPLRDVPLGTLSIIAVVGLLYLTRQPRGRVTASLSSVVAQ